MATTQVTWTRIHAPTMTPGGGPERWSARPWAIGELEWHRGNASLLADLVGPSHYGGWRTDRDVITIAPTVKLELTSSPARVNEPMDVS